MRCCPSRAVRPDLGRGRHLRAEDAGCHQQVPEVRGRFRRRPHRSARQDDPDADRLHCRFADGTAGHARPERGRPARQNTPNAKVPPPTEIEKALAEAQQILRELEPRLKLLRIRLTPVTDPMQGLLNKHFAAGNDKVKPGDIAHVSTVLRNIHIFVARANAFGLLPVNNGCCSTTLRTRGISGPIPSREATNCRPTSSRSCSTNFSKRPKKFNGQSLWLTRLYTDYPAKEQRQRVLLHEFCHLVGPSRSRPGLFDDTYIRISSSLFWAGSSGCTTATRWRCSSWSGAWATRTCPAYPDLSTRRISASSRASTAQRARSKSGTRRHGKVLQIICAESHRSLRETALLPPLRSQALDRIARDGALCRTAGGDRHRDRRSQNLCELAQAHEPHQFQKLHNAEIISLFLLEVCVGVRRGCLS